MTLATKTQAVADAIGPVNFYQVGTFEAAEQMQAKTPAGYSVHVEGSGPVPLGAVRVGQVKVRHADQPRSLYVYQRALSTGDVAALMGVDRRTVTNWCESGRLEGATQTPGGHWRIPAGSRGLHGR
jgi:excisionase family DNA binding protein